MQQTAVRPASGLPRDFLDSLVQLRQSYRLLFFVHSCHRYKECLSVLVVKIAAWRRQGRQARLCFHGWLSRWCRVPEKQKVGACASTNHECQNKHNDNCAAEIGHGFVPFWSGLLAICVKIHGRLIMSALEAWNLFFAGGQRDGSRKEAGHELSEIRLRL